MEHEEATPVVTAHVPGLPFNTDDKGVQGSETPMVILMTVC